MYAMVLQFEYQLCCVDSFVHEIVLCDQLLVQSICDTVVPSMFVDLHRSLVMSTQDEAKAHALAAESIAGSVRLTQRHYCAMHGLALSFRFFAHDQVGPVFDQCKEAKKVIFKTVSWQCLQIINQRSQYG